MSCETFRLIDLNIESLYSTLFFETFRIIYITLIVVIVLFKTRITRTLPNSAFSLTHNPPFHTIVHRSLELPPPYRNQHQPGST